MKTYFLLALALFLSIVGIPETFSQTEPSPYLFGHEIEVDEHRSSEQDSRTFEQKFMNMLFVLGMLIAFMVFAAWALKRTMKTRTAGINLSSAIKIVETRKLSPGSVLYLLDVKGRTILVGETTSGISKLASFPEGEYADRIASFPERSDSNPMT